MKEWSKEYTECIICKSTDIKHLAKGMCSKCYYKQRDKNYNKPKGDYICLCCGKHFSINYKRSLSKVPLYCSKDCMNKHYYKSNGEEYRFDKNKLEDKILKEIMKQDKYLTLKDITSSLKISSKTLTKLGVSVASLNKKAGMSKAKSEFEEKCFNIINDIFTDIECQKSFDDCLSPKGYKLFFDFYIPSEKLLIEADGVQHTTLNHIWSSEYTLSCDKAKNEWCKKIITN